MPQAMHSVSPLQVRTVWNRVLIPTPQVKTLFSIPVIILPATPGMITLPIFYTVNKPAGTAYTNTGNTNLGIRWMSAGGVLILNIRNLPVVNLLTVAPATFWTDKANGAGAGYTTADPVGSYIEIKLDTADLVVGDAPLDISVIGNVWGSTLGGF